MRIKWDVFTYFVLVLSGYDAVMSAVNFSEENKTWGVGMAIFALLTLFLLYIQSREYEEQEGNDDDAQ